MPTYKHFTTNYTGTNMDMQRRATDQIDPLRDRGDILTEAKKIINGERTNIYGEPENSFPFIADSWNLYLKMRFGDHPANLDAKDVTIMMVHFKLCREAVQGKRDNLRDAAGYIGIASYLDEDQELSRLRALECDRDLQDISVGTIDPPAIDPSK